MVGMYELSANLQGHLQDVKDLVAIDDKRIASVSRDGTLRVWSKRMDSNTALTWQDSILFTAETFLNSVSFDPATQVVYFGGKDCFVNGVSLFATAAADPEYTLIAHKGNVCSMSEYKGTLISGSWDKTAKVWMEGTCKWDLKGHAASVWDAKSIPGNETSNRFITVSADMTIKIWENDKCVSTFDNIHQDVIRHVAILDDAGKLFATCSNDGFIKILDDKGKVKKTLEGHESFVYSVQLNRKTGELVSCGEDRSVRIWDWETGRVKQVIRLPAISIWCVDCLPNGDIVAGGSDNLIRIFTRDQERLAPTEEIEELKREVEETALNSKSMGIDESHVLPYETLNTAGNKEGQVVAVRTPGGVIEAHQFSNGSWTKIGDVVGSSSSGSNAKTEYEGKKYDFVFDVDIEDGKPPLKLPVNVSGNPYDIADKFIMRYELPSSYRDQIVNFIVTNTGGMALDSEPTTAQPKPSQTVPSNAKAMSMFPIREYLSLASFKPDALLQGIVKFNSDEKTFSDDELALIGSSLHDLDSGWEILYNFATVMREKWGNKTAAYDLIRLIVKYLPAASNISAFIDEGLNNPNIVLTMLTVRILVNCFGNEKWGKQLMASRNVYDSVFETIGTIFPDATLRQSQTLGTAVATLLSNYSVLALDNSELDIVPILSEALNNKYGPLEEYQESEETAYRLVVAFGNLASIEPALRQVAGSLKWLSQVKRRYAHINRFQPIFQDLE